MQNAGARLFPGDYGYVDTDDLYCSESDGEGYDCPYNTEEDEEEEEVITWPRLARTSSDQTWALKAQTPGGWGGAGRMAARFAQESDCEEPDYMRCPIVNKGFDP